MDISHGSSTTNPAGSPRLEISDQTGSVRAPNDEFDSFVTLTAKPANVSKDELDEQRKAAS